MDLLANVPLRTQEDAWLLLRVEVQGRGGNEDFPLRMHRYRGLLEGRYRRHVSALALLIEPLSEAQSCGVYSWEGYGTRVKYEFPVFKLYEGDEEALRASGNPFDWAHLAGLRAWKSRNSEPRKLSYLKEMLKLLDERGWDHADKAQLLVFMEGVIHLTEDESSREYEEWESALEEAKEAGRMYVSIMVSWAGRRAFNWARQGASSWVRQGVFSWVRQGASNWAEQKRRGTCFGWGWT